MNNLLNFFGKARVYMKRGTGTYLQFPVSLFSTALIIYNFAFKDIECIPDCFKHTYVFIPLILIIYLPLAVYLGYIDVNKGMYRSEMNTKRNINPMWVEINKKLDKLLERK